MAASVQNVLAAFDAALDKVEEATKPLLEVLTTTRLEHDIE